MSTSGAWEGLGWGLAWTVAAHSVGSNKAQTHSPVCPVWYGPMGCVHRYASLFFVACIDKEDNELITLEMIHLFVEVASD